LKLPSDSNFWGEFDGESIQHNGKLIKDLMVAVEKAEQAASPQSVQDCSVSEPSTQDLSRQQNTQPVQTPPTVDSESEQLA
jgi:hypothetical protein